MMLHEAVATLSKGLGPAPILLVALLFLVTAVVLIRRYRATSPVRAGLRHGPRPDAAVRRSDAFATLFIGAALLFMVVTEAGYGGAMLRVRSLDPQFAAMHLWWTLGASAAVLAGALLIWRGFAASGAVIGLLGVVAAWTVLTSGANAASQDPLRAAAAAPREEVSEPRVTFEVNRVDCTPELWINGVNLGRLPVTLTRDELREKIPAWTPDEPRLREMVEVEQYRPWWQRPSEPFMRPAWTPIPAHYLESRMGPGDGYARTGNETEYGGAGVMDPGLGLAGSGSETEYGAAGMIGPGLGLAGTGNETGYGAAGTPGSPIRTPGSARPFGTLPGAMGPGFGPPRTGSETAYWYAVRLGGCWGAQGGGGAGGNGGDLHVSLNPTFPEVDRRLLEFINKARLNGYEADAAWLAAAETWGDGVWRLLKEAAGDDRRGPGRARSHGDIWRLLRETAADEPRLEALMDDLATHKYSLDQVTNADSAWSVLETICDEVEASRRYALDSLAAHALGRIVHWLDHERLADEVVSMIEPDASLNAWALLDFKYLGDRSITLVRRPAEHQWQSGMGSLLPARFVVLADATWLLNDHLLTAVPDEPTVIQERVGPALLRRAQSEATFIALAALLGGPDFWKYAKRMLAGYYPGSVEPSAHKPHHRPQYSEDFILYAALHSPTPGGRRFRMENEQRMFLYADKRLSHYSPRVERLAFLFLDADENSGGLAAEFLPELPRWIGDGTTHPTEAMDLAVDYLVRLEPHATLEMYQDLWRRLTPQGRLLDSLNHPYELLMRIPPERALALTRWLLEEAQPKENSEAAWHLLHARVELLDPEALAEWEAKMLDPQRGAEKRQWMSDWLENDRPDHRPVEYFARHANPALRVLAVPALAEFTPPERLQLLRDLARDSDEEVRTAAREALAAVERLAAADPAQWARSDSSEPAMETAASTVD